MYMTRQQRRKAERAQDALLRKGAAFRKASPMAEEVHRQGYEEGWKAACGFCMRVCYAASVLTLHDLEGYGQKRNTRFLRRMDNYITDTLSSDEIIDEALQKAGVAIKFDETFSEERVQEVAKQ
jgi:hypothetical protein